MENEIAGMYLSGHPMDDYSEFAAAIHADKTGAILRNEGGKYRDGAKVTLVGIISRVKNQITKSEKLMAFITLDDRFGTMEAVVFPNVYEKFGAYLNEGNAVVMRGTLNFKENEEPKLLCDTAEKARTNDECKKMGRVPAQQPPKPKALYLRIDDLDTDLYRKAKRVLDIFDGRTPVIFRLTASDRVVKAPQSMCVDLNDVMIGELKYQLGEENVAVR